MSLASGGSFFGLRQKPFACASDKAVGEADARALNLIPSLGDRLLAITNHGRAVSVDLDLHVLRRAEASGEAFLDVAEQLELAFRISVGADKPIVIGQNAV